MARCEICGTESENKINVGGGEESLLFSSSGMLIQAAPEVCVFCGSRITEARSDGAIYCYDDLSDIEF